MRDDYDVVIVGARCAGATLATFLGRAGAKVLLLDKASLPSDQVLSTHSIHPPGMDVLDEVGVGPAVREEAPASRIIRANTDGVVVDLVLPEGRAEYCPRRERLDGLLQQAAIAAGAEMLDRTRVASLLWEGGRVRGVRAANGDRDLTFTGGLVVGADGRRSTVARLVEADEYLGYDGPRAGYWGYWDAPSFWRTDPAYRFDMYFSHVGGDPRVVFQTDRNQLLIGSWPTLSRAGAWRSPALPEALASDPVIGPLTCESSPHGGIRGTLKEQFFFRRGAGPGWALVGDAGHHKEFVLGDGITEALLQARSLAAAIGEGREGSLRRWWRARDVDAIPLYFLGKAAAALERPPTLQRFLAERLGSEPALSARFSTMVAERAFSALLRAIPAPRLLWWTLCAALLGRPRVIGELWTGTRWATAVMREIRVRKRLLAEAEAATGVGVPPVDPPPFARSGRAARSAPDSAPSRCGVGLIDR